MALDFFMPDDLAKIIADMEESLVNLRKVAAVLDDNKDAIALIPEGEGLLIHHKTISDHYMPVVVKWSGKLEADVKGQLREIRRGNKTREQRDKERHAQTKAEKGKHPAKKK